MKINYLDIWNLCYLTCVYNTSSEFKYITLEDITIMSEHDGNVACGN